MESIPLNILVFIVTIGVIAKGAILLVDSAARIAARLGISELVIGLTVVAFGTSAPEVGVTVLAALRNSGDISIGNVVGSNIINFTIILGGTALFAALNTPRAVIRRDGPFLIACTLLFVFILLDNNLSSIESAVLLTLFVGYMAFLFIKREAISDDFHPGEMKTYDPLLVLVGLGMVIGGAHFMVESAVIIARTVGISEWIIGATIVAFGTSAPEIATSLVAAIRGHHAMSMGNLVGSNIFNLLLVLGIAGTINPLSIDPSGSIDILLMAGVIVVVYVFAVTGKRVSKLEGAVLVSLGVAHWLFGYLR
ncbi:MAG: calcium/sodium antiporter [candidate division Zixibacteria bacterium]